MLSQLVYNDGKTAECTVAQSSRQELLFVRNPKLMGNLESQNMTYMYTVHYTGHVTYLYKSRNLESFYDHVKYISQ